MLNQQQTDVQRQQLRELLAKQTKQRQSKKKQQEEQDGVTPPMGTPDQLTPGVDFPMTGQCMVLSL